MEGGEGNGSNAAMEEVENETMESSGPRSLWNRWRSGKLAPRLTPRRRQYRRRHLHNNNRRQPPKPKILTENQTVLSSLNNKNNDDNDKTLYKPPSSPPRRAIFSDKNNNKHNDNDAYMVTPRVTLSSNLLSDDAAAFTPPVSSPTPLVVSAKRFGSEVRREHSKRRRGRNGGMSEWRESLPYSSSSSDDDDPEEKNLFTIDSIESLLDPDERTKRYWTWCYGTTPTQNNNNNKSEPQDSWSASRAPPAKSWYVSFQTLFACVNVAVCHVQELSCRLFSFVQFVIWHETKGRCRENTDPNTAYARSRRNHLPDIPNSVTRQQSDDDTSGNSFAFQKGAVWTNFGG